MYDRASLGTRKGTCTPLMNDCKRQIASGLSQGSTREQVRFDPGTGRSALVRQTEYDAESRRRALVKIDDWFPVHEAVLRMRARQRAVTAAGSLLGMQSVRRGP